VSISLKNTILFVILLVIIGSNAIVMLCKHTFAYENNTINPGVNPNTLESIINQSGSLESTAQINVDKGPTQILGADVNGYPLYVANSGSSTVSVINTATNAVKDISVPGFPTSISGDPTSKIYVADGASSTVSVINTATNTVKNIPVGSDPVNIFGNPDSAMYVANILSNTISVINTTTNTVDADIPVGRDPVYIFGSTSYSSLYVANSGSDTVSVIQTCWYETCTPENTFKVKDIPVGRDPVYIFGDPFTKIYVANSGSNTVSVINTKTNGVEANIPVGRKPVNIFGDPFTKIYVANSGSNTVSVINTKTNGVEANIPVGRKPVYGFGITNMGQENTMGHLMYSHAIFVANSDSNTISVINTTTNTVKNIPVGRDPVYIFGDPSYSDAIYVANSDSNGISLIDVVTGKVVAAVTFKTSPSRTGDIICNQTLHAPTDRFMYISSGTSCTAKPIKGFEFSSWRQILDDNSSRTVSVASGSPWISLLDAFYLKPDDPAATITINRFGNFTAYFSALSPPLPAEYWASLFTVAVTALVGSWLTPTLIGWRKEKRQGSKLDYYLSKITDLPNDDKISSNLERLKNEITLAYAKGKINKEQYDKLTNDISIRYMALLETEMNVSYVNHAPMDEVMEGLADAYSKGRITELHYKVLKERMSRMNSRDDIHE
jgi:YVTN family beta-propeller protein